MKTNKAKMFAGVLMAAVCLGWPEPARAFWTDGGQAGGAFEQLGLSADVKDAELALPQPEAAVPAGAAARDVFMEIQACAAVDWNLVEGRPTTKYALKRLAPCMEGLSRLYGNKVYVESTIMNPDNLQIVVLDPVAGKTIVEDLKASLAKRDGRLYGHAVWLSVMDPEYTKK